MAWAGGGEGFWREEPTEPGRPQGGVRDRGWPGQRCALEGGAGGGLVSRSRPFLLQEGGSASVDENENVSGCSGSLGTCRPCLHHSLAPPDPPEPSPRDVAAAQTGQRWAGDQSVSPELRLPVASTLGGKLRVTALVPPRPPGPQQQHSGGPRPSHARAVSVLAAALPERGLWGADGLT